MHNEVMKLSLKLLSEHNKELKLAHDELVPSE